MAKAEKLLERMKANPLDWQMSDVETVCSAFGVECTAPRGGSHYKIKHGEAAEILTIPSRKPIKPVYIRDLVRFIEAVKGASS